MADFCQQCSEDLFGPEAVSDFAGMLTDQEKADGYMVTVLCEGCGPIQVDGDGVCQSSDCDNQHGGKPNAR